MLNGVDPIILFNLKKLTPSLQSAITKIPVVASIVSAIDLPVIPLYLSERLTGIFIASENKSVEIDTSIDTLTNGSQPEVNQRAITNSVRIEMKAKSSSIGLSLFSAMSDLIFPKVTSKEYSITYLHGAITVFAGILHSFNISQSPDDDLYRVSLELIKPTGGGPLATAIPTVARVTGAAPL